MEQEYRRHRLASIMLGKVPMTAEQWAEATKDDFIERMRLRYEEIYQEELHKAWQYYLTHFWADDENLMVHEHPHAEEEKCPVG
jgi:hypothetical protein